MMNHAAERRGIKPTGRMNKEKDVRKSIYIYICVSLFIFSSASPWEGSGVIAPAGELPETGFFIATNAYPRNTVVDITNLETEKSTRVIVANTLDSPGLLAIVSREAAELIGMKAGIINRIIIVQPPEPIAYLRFRESLTTGVPGYDSGNVITEESLYDTYTPPVVVTQEKTEPVASGISGPSYTLEPEWQDKEIVDIPFNTPVTESVYEEEPEYITEDESFYEYDFYDDDEYIAEDDYYEYDFYDDDEYIVEDKPFYEEEPEYIAEDETEYNIVEAEERPPEGSIYGIDPEDIISGIDRPPQVTESEKPPHVIPELLSVPKLTKGGYYVQIAALESPELFENTVRKIDHKYWPIVFDDGNNLYRILLGPLNQGESAAVLQRFKSIGYNDAFVRHVR
jgi:hypothetical protein